MPSIGRTPQPDTGLNLENFAFSRREALASILATSFFGLELRVLSAQGTQQQPEIPYLKVGTAFPELKLTDEKGKELELAKVGKGKLVLVEFWGVWCGPCLQEVPNLNKAYQALKQKEFKHGAKGEVTENGFEVFAVAFHNDPSFRQTWLNMISNKQVQWRYNVESNDMPALNKLGVTGFPTNYLLDGTGKILAVNVDPGSTELLAKSARKKQ